MTRISRRDLVEVFHARFAETRSIGDAVDAVATEIEARCETSIEARAREAEARLAKLREEFTETGKAVLLRLRTEKPRRPRRAPPKKRHSAPVLEWSPSVGVTSDDILAAVAGFHGLDVDDILSGDRARGPSLARHQSMWLHREVGKVSDETIAKLHHVVDHTTVIAARRKIQALVDADPAYGRRLMALVAPAAAGEARRAA